MKPLAAGVKINRRHVLENVELNPAHSSGLFKYRYAVYRLKPLHRSLFYYRLTVRYAVKPGFQGMTLHRKRVKPTDISFKRQAFYALKQLLKAVRMERTELDKHPLGSSKTYVSLGSHPYIAVKGYPSVSDRKVLSAYALNFKRQYALQPEMAWAAIPDSLTHKNPRCLCTS